MAKVFHAKIRPDGSSKKLPLSREFNGSSSGEIGKSVSLISREAAVEPQTGKNTGSEDRLIAAALNSHHFCAPQIPLTSVTITGLIQNLLLASLAKVSAEISKRKISSKTVEMVLNISVPNAGLFRPILLHQANSRNFKSAVAVEASTPDLFRGPMAVRPSYESAG